MPTLSEFAEQLSRCAQSPDEVRAFVEAFSQVRLRYIARQLVGRQAAASWMPAVAARRPPAEPVAPDWGDADALEASGLTREQVAASASPGDDWLHVAVAMDAATASKARVARFVTETCLSDKQRRALFPGLSAMNFATGEMQSRRRAEVPKLNQWLAWARSEGIRPALFGDYQRHLRIHGASQNAGGDVGATGGAIAILDALREIAPGCGLEMLGGLPGPGRRHPLQVDGFLRQHGIGPESSERPLKCILLPNRRAVVFASDPDVAIIQSLREPFRSAEEAWTAYSEVRNNAQLRAQRVHEFAVGETKTATDPSNLHERMALSTRETRFAGESVDHALPGAMSRHEAARSFSYGLPMSAGTAAWRRRCRQCVFRCSRVPVFPGLARVGKRVCRCSMCSRVRLPTGALGGTGEVGVLQL